MFVACGIWCLADVSSVSPSSEQTLKVIRSLGFIYHAQYEEFNRKESDGEFVIFVGFYRRFHN